MTVITSKARKRLARRRWPFQVIGLTGSVAMGKSTAASMLARMGLTVFDADAAVHDLTGPNGEALSAIAERFPDVIDGHGVDRQALGNTVFNNADALADLEAILHPLVVKKLHRFLVKHANQRSRGVVLDIPLLFEMGRQNACDAVIVISAPFMLQRQRALLRPGMSDEKFNRILARQMPDKEKQRLANVVIPSSLGKRETWRRLQHAINAMMNGQSPGMARSDLNA